jgi:hypothetical protein
MIFISQILYAIFCISFAYLNYRLIVKGERIRHAWNGIAHLVVWLLLYLLTKDWKLFIALPFIGRVSFDTALNYFRGISIYYIPKKPASIIDRIEKWLFDNAMMARVIYCTFIIAINIWYVTVK